MSIFSNLTSLRALLEYLKYSKLIILITVVGSNPALRPIDLLPESTKVHKTLTNQRLQRNHLPPLSIEIYYYILQKVVTNVVHFI